MLNINVNYLTDTPNPSSYNEVTGTYDTTHYIQHLELPRVRAGIRRRPWCAAEVHAPIHIHIVSNE